MAGIGAVVATVTSILPVAA